eukprot:CAMPEP_0197514480 /NCGR_PEP_ID=MMETSP1312-20131121/81208_1 /TAXON_ID=464262 /ORGANISM="Genus nov. species nov., Strain RCC2335" /LENGTH=119 /DNA_ID=CAMNT_0043062621 /DNA_START=7499 /DNA_END=7858 /DNA_ORIENTATION=-
MAVDGRRLHLHVRKEEVKIFFGLGVGKSDSDEVELRALAGEESHHQHWPPQMIEFICCVGRKMACRGCGPQHVGRAEDYAEGGRFEVHLVSDAPSGVPLVVSHCLHARKRLHILEALQR